MCGILHSNDVGHGTDLQNATHFKLNWFHTSSFCLLILCYKTKLATLYIYITSPSLNPKDTFT